MKARWIHAVVNPASANGRTRKEWPKLLRMIEAEIGQITWEMTAGPGHAADLAAEALRSGCTHVISVGGDGTHQEVANAFIARHGPLYPDAVLGLLSRGTGGDLAKSLGIPKRPQEAIRCLAQERVTRMDAGWIRYTDPEGTQRQRAFLNVASMGIGGEVDLRVNRTSKALGGFISFLWATLISLLAFRGKHIGLSLDDGPWIQRDVILVAVANGQFFGGGMWIAPTALVDDGAFSVVIVRQMGLPELLPKLGKIYKGTHLTHPKVELLQASKVVAKSTDQVWLDVDGEPLGTLPAELHVIPRAIKVIVGPGPRLGTLHPIHSPEE